jgi:hypothetical protein
MPVNKWIRNNDDIRRYDDMNVYPDTSQCPKNIFNLWRPFYITLFTGAYVEKTAEMADIYEHIRILCDNDTPIFECVLDWIAHMLQYSARKSIIPTLYLNRGRVWRL